MVGDSSLGDWGTRFVKFAVLVLLTSRGGIWRLNPREAKVVLLGVMGVGAANESSLESEELSIKAGEGESWALVSCEVQGRSGI